MEPDIRQMEPVYNNSVRITSVRILPSTPGIAACVEAGLLPFNYQWTATVAKRTTGFLEKTHGDTTGVYLLEEAKRLLASVANKVLPPVAKVHLDGARS